MSIGRRIVFRNWYNMPERSVSPGILYLPVARSPVDGDQGGQDADQEEDQHHILTICIVLPGWPAGTEVIILRIKTSPITPEPSSSPGSIQVRQVVVVDYPCIYTELVSSRLVNTRG